MYGTVSISATSLEEAYISLRREFDAETLYATDTDVLIDKEKSYRENKGK